MKSSRSIRPSTIVAATIALAAGGYLAVAAAGASWQAPTTTAAPRGANAVAHESTAHRNLGHLKGEADFVFQGEVIDLRYAMSQSGGVGQAPIPYTFVTYRVDSVLKGEASDSVITLRFIGGYDEQRGAYLGSSITPLFDVGDRDILFVQGNGDRMTPLVNETSGRLRVIDGLVYTEMGRAVNIGESDVLAIGDSYKLEDVITTYVNGTPQTIDLGPKARTDPSDAATLTEIVDAIINAPMLSVNPTVAFVSADPTIPFTSRDFSAAGPPENRGEAVLLSHEDRRELESFARPNHSIVRTQGPRPARSTARQDRQEDTDHDG